MHLLMGSRKAHAEGIVTLYRHNIFCFRDRDTLPSFAVRVPSHSPNLIRSIQVPWESIYLESRNAIEHADRIRDALERSPNQREICVVQPDGLQRFTWELDMG